jgi:hypothetical protein
VRAVPVRVPRARRAHLLLLLPDRRQVPLVEEPRADQLPAGGKTLIKQAQQSILHLIMLLAKHKKTTVLKANGRVSVSEISIVEQSDKNGWSTDAETLSSESSLMSHDRPKFIRFWQSQRLHYRLSS